MTVAEQLIRRGVRQGMQQGMQQGMREGMQNALCLVAKNLLKSGAEISFVLKCTGLSAEMVASLRDSA